uniref:Uncharacterized protein n=1 Tax=Nelumbo nucifera TaxID=4432 RepID=A0A822XHP9_NELNU|nr:TPA_asm: hypothetical protein HUJ06_020124 [Nelumbo nucifera]
MGFVQASPTLKKRKKKGRHQDNLGSPTAV